MCRRSIVPACWLLLGLSICAVSIGTPPRRASEADTVARSVSEGASRSQDLLGNTRPEAPLLSAEAELRPTFAPSGAWDGGDGDSALRTPSIRLCQAYGPAPWTTACERPLSGVDSGQGDGCGELKWNAWGPIPWQAFAQGEYVGPARSSHVPEYHLRVDDEIEFIYRLTREELGHKYQLEVGDVIRIESIIDPNLNREISIQPDGTIDVLLLGQVRAARLTVEEIRRELNEQYKKFYKVTDINVTRVKTQTRLEDLRAAVDSRFFSGGQGKRVRVTPEGTVSLPSIGVVPAQGLSLDEIKREVDARYGEVVDGLEVTPILAQRAGRFIFVVGEVRNPGRFDLQGPTTVMQSIALAGGWNNGGNLRQIVVFRRAEDWRLLATKIDVRGALYAERPSPADEIWLRDSDIIVVPKMPIQRLDDALELVFTRGIYRAFPISFGYQFWNGTSTITAD